MLTPQEQMRIICKGVHLMVNEEELLVKLIHSYEQNRPLIVKLGLDPSAPDIHLGHAVVLRKMKQMQDLGHQAVIVIGDFTGKIGDSTGKAKGRAALSDEQVKANSATYCEQIFKILDKEKTEVRYNSEWLAKLNLQQAIQLAASATVARILERDDFQNRYQNQVAIGIHEFFYPLMQAYDSVVLQADIEIGGTDQTFNVLMGRTVQRDYGQEQQIALFMPILEGLDGVTKMSKSLGNYIGISEPAEVMFKKVMEVPDHLIIRFFELATDEHPDSIDQIKAELSSGVNPRDVKYRLAQIITGLYHGAEGMANAKQYYDTAFAKKEIPEQMPEFSLTANQATLFELIPQLIAIGFVKSKSDFLRLLQQGAIQINGEKIQVQDPLPLLADRDVVKIGKKRFFRIRL